MNPIDTIKGKITDYDESGRLVIEARYDNVDRLIKRQYKDVEITLIDSRPLSDKQRKMCWAIIGDIAEWQGERQKDLVSTALKWNYIANLGETTVKLFSLASASMSLIADYQRFLIRFVIENDVPTKVPLYEYAEDINDYVYQCLINKKCAVCGQLAELHHLTGSKVGMGFDRDEIIHEGLECISLCRNHHVEAHSKPEFEFMKLYHFDKGVELDKTLCKIYKLKSKEK